MNDSDVIDRLARIDVKLDQLLARNDDHETRIRELEQRPDGAKVEKRVRELERWQWKRDGLLMFGSSGITGAIVAAIHIFQGGTP